MLLLYKYVRKTLSRNFNNVCNDSQTHATRQITSFHVLPSLPRVLGTSQIRNENFLCPFDACNPISRRGKKNRCNTKNEKREEQDKNNGRKCRIFCQARRDQIKCLIYGFSWCDSQLRRLSHFSAYMYFRPYTVQNPTIFSHFPSPQVSYPFSLGTNTIFTRKEAKTFTRERVTNQHVRSRNIFLVFERRYYFVFDPLALLSL